MSCSIETGIVGVFEADQGVVPAEVGIATGAVDGTTGADGGTANEGWLNCGSGLGIGNCCDPLAGTEFEDDARFISVT